MVIKDAPRFQHRGLMLDTGRRFVPMSLLFNFVDAMSYSKMNILHLHLSDMPGYRMQSLVRGVNFYWEHNPTFIQSVL
jgi:hexosaminidase